MTVEKYKAKPHEIEAFQFTKDKTSVPPDWFFTAYKKGQVQVTMNENDNYITVYGDDQFEKAYDKDWICLSHCGKIYVLDNVSFERSYHSECQK